MPKSWSAKDERQYEHVKESEAKEGRSPARAKSIAARTVNKQRSTEGRTKTGGSTGKAAAPRGKQPAKTRGTKRATAAKKAGGRKRVARAR